MYPGHAKMTEHEAEGENKTLPNVAFPNPQQSES